MFKCCLVTQETIPEDLLCAIPWAFQASQVGISGTTIVVGLNSQLCPWDEPNIIAINLAD